MLVKDPTCKIKFPSTASASQPLVLLKRLNAKQLLKYKCHPYQNIKDPSSLTSNTVQNLHPNTRPKTNNLNAEFSAITQHCKSSSEPCAPFVLSSNTVQQQSCYLLKSSDDSNPRVLVFSHGNGTLHQSHGATTFPAEIERQKMVLLQPPSNDAQPSGLVLLPSNVSGERKVLIPRTNVNHLILLQKSNTEEQPLNITNKQIHLQQTEADPKLCHASEQLIASQHPFPPNNESDTAGQEVFQQRYNTDQLTNDGGKQKTLLKQSFTDAKSSTSGGEKNLLQQSSNTDTIIETDDQIIHLLEAYSNSQASNAQEKVINLQKLDTGPKSSISGKKELLLQKPKTPNVGVKQTDFQEKSDSVYKSRTSAGEEMVILQHHKTCYKSSTVGEQNILSQQPGYHLNSLNVSDKQLVLLHHYTDHNKLSNVVRHKVTSQQPTDDRNKPYCGDQASLLHLHNVDSKSCNGDGEQMVPIHHINNTNQKISTTCDQGLLSKQINSDGNNYTSLVNVNEEGSKTSYDGSKQIVHLQQSHSDSEMPDKLGNKLILLKPINVDHQSNNINNRQIALLQQSNGQCSDSSGKQMVLSEQSHFRKHIVEGVPDLLQNSYPLGTIKAASGFPTSQSSMPPVAHVAEHPINPIPFYIKVRI